MKENFLIVSSFIFEVIQKAIIPNISQKPCFLIKKNLSPIVELASLNEEIEIKMRPIKIKLKTKNNRGDLVFFI